jgi:DNA-binding XRE family transcriptional regulator
MITQDRHNAASAKKGVLTPEDVLRIKHGLLDGEGVNALATIFGVSEQTITRIRDGKTWAWLKTAQETISLPPRREGKEMPPEAMAASLAEVLARINQPKEEEGEGLAALGKAIEEGKKGERMLEDLIGDRAKELRGETK